MDLTCLREQSGDKGRKFAQSFASSRRSITRMSSGTANRVVGLIGEFREEIRDRLKFFAPDDPNAPFDIRILPQVQSNINTAIEDLSRLGGQEIIAGINKASDIGAAVTANGLRAAGVNIAIPNITPELLGVVAREPVNIFSEVVSDLGDNIFQRLNASAVSLDSSTQAIRKITRLLKTSKEARGGFRRRIGFSFQSEQIVRTELGRIYSTAQQAASERIRESIPDLRKRWVTVGDRRVRDGHSAVEASSAPGGETGPILIEDEFVVVDLSRIGTSRFFTRTTGFGAQRVYRRKKGPFARQGSIVTDRMLHPRAAGASAGNVVGCRCTVMDTVPDLEGAIDQALGIVQEG